MPPDYSQMSMEELQAIAGGGSATTQAPVAAQPAAPLDYSQMSMEQLRQIAGAGQTRTFADSVGNVAKDFVRGSQELIQMLPVPGNPYFSPLDGLGESLSRALGQEPGLSQSDILDLQRQQYVGNPDYTNAGPVERYAGAGARMLPFGVLGGPGSAFASGVGGEVAKDLGYNPIFGQFAGGGLYDLAKSGGSAVINMFTKGGREQLAANSLKGAIGQEGVDRLIANGPNAQGLTMAEVAQTPGAANLQMQLGKDLGPGNVIGEQLATRAGQRIDDLKALAPGSFEGVTADIRGEALRAGAQPIKQVADDMSSAAWKAARGSGGEINLTQAQKVIKAEVAATIGETTNISSQGQRVIDAVTKDSASIPVGKWPQIRSDAGEALGAAAANGRGVEARMMAIIREQLDGAATSAAEKGMVDPQGVDLIKNAIATTKQVEGVYGSGVAADVAKRSDFGSFRYAPSSLPQKVIATPESAKQFMTAYGKAPEMVAQARATLVDTMTKQGPDTWVKYFNEKRPQFKAIFGDDFLNVKKVMDNLASENSVGQLAQKATGRGSITSQAMTTINYLTDSTRVLRSIKNAGVIVGAGAGGASGGSMAAAVLGGVAGEAVSKLAGYAERDIKSALARMVVEPGYAAKLLAKPSASLVQDVTSNVLRILGSASAQDQQKSQQTTASPRGPQLEATSPNSAKAQAIPQQKLELPSSNLRPNPAATQAQNGGAVQDVSFIKQLPSLVQAVIGVESRGNPRAVSEAGALGLMQLMPENIKTFGVSDPFDPLQNVEAGRMLLAEELDRYKDEKLALAAYNAGSPKVNRAIQAAGSRDWAIVQRYLPKETRDYVSKVFREQYLIESATA
jgi:soluble lytic murein transglycosylase-like protein